MFPELNNILDIGPEHPPVGKFMFVNGKGADCSFMLHHLVALYLKGGHNVCFVAFAQSYGHYSNVGNKLGVNYNNAKQDGTLVFIEGLKSLGEALLVRPDCDDREFTEGPIDIFMKSKSPSLKSLYDHVYSSLQTIPNLEAKPTLLIIDDIGILLDLGLSAKEIMNFCCHLQHLVCPTKSSTGSVAVLLQKDLSAEDEDYAILETSLHHQSSLVVLVEGLSSGYSKDVHGQISIEWQDPAQRQPQASTYKQMQFKITDKNVTFFALGMSAAVL